MVEKHISLHEDQKIVILEALEEMHSTYIYLYEWVKNDSLTEEMSKLLPSNIENYFSRIAKELSYESHLLKERERRFLELKEANQKIQALEEQLALNKPADGLKEKLSYLSTKVSEWWKIEGFNHLGDSSFISTGLFSVKFHFMLIMRNSRSLSNTPATNARDNKGHIQNLRELGFQFADFEEGQSEKLCLIDNPNNRNLLIRMLKERFPSIQIQGWNSRRSCSDPEVFVLFEIDTMIWELTDI